MVERALGLVLPHLNLEDLAGRQVGRVASLQREHPFANVVGQGQSVNLLRNTNKSSMSHRVICLDLWLLST